MGREPKVNHNRKRNVGIVYELLVRRMGSQIVSGDRVSAGQTFNIIREYFGKDSPLRQELSLFEAVLESRDLSTNVARKLLQRISFEAKSLDESKLEATKGRMIGELNRTFGKDFFSSHRIPNYKMLASIQVYIDSRRHKKSINEESVVLRIEESLIEYMKLTEENRGNVLDKRVDNLTVSLVEKKFKERYGKILSKEQLRLISEHSVSSLSGNSDKFKETYITSLKNSCEIIEKSLKTDIISQDKDMKLKMEQVLSEGMNKISSYSNNVPCKEDVEDALLYLGLAKEISSDE